MDEIGKFGGEKAHIPKERCDFACCCLLACSKMRFLSILKWMKSENLAAKKRTFRRKGAILLLACCGQKMQFPDAKKCTFRRKGVILPNARSCEKVQISKVMLDFACCLLLLNAVFELF